MPKPFDETTWRSRIAAWWRETAQDPEGTMRRLGVRTAYGLLTAGAWLPLLTAYAEDPGPAVAALVGVLSGVGTNLLSNLVQGVYEEATVPQQVEREIAERPDLRAEYQQMLARLEVLAAAQDALGEQWADFAARLREELTRLGGDLRVETGGAAVIFGNVRVQYGDLVGRDKIVIQIGTPPPVPDVTRLLEIYLRHLAERCGYLSLRGLDARAGDATARAARPRLAQVYIYLDTTTLVADGEGGRGKRHPPEMETLLERGEARRLGALEAVVVNRRAVLLGAPGYGKSAFVHHMAFCLAMARLESEGNWLKHLPGWPADEADALPILVTLRDFARWLVVEERERGTARTLEDFIADWLADHALVDFIGLLREMLRRGKTVVLLDGLDEVPSRELRGLVRDAVAAFAAQYPRCRFVVTCRTLSYQDPAWQLEGFPAFELAPFDEEKIDRFIEAWYGELTRLGVVRAEDAEGLARRLREAVRRPDLWRLAPNPLLLTVMALVHTHKGRLPEARALLYEDTVDLLLWRWEQVKAVGDKTVPRLRQLLLDAGRTDVDLKRVLWQLAFEACREGKAGEGPTIFRELHLLKVLAALHPEESWGWAQQVIEAMKLRAGLLLERTPEVFTFPHRTLQEYLAGAYLSSQADFARQAARLIEEGVFWREVILLAVGRLVYLGGDMDKPLALVGELCPAEAVDEEVAWRKAWLAGEVLVEMGLSRVRESALGRDLVERVRHRLAMLVETERLSPHERAEAGVVLGRLGDPRPGTGVTPDGMPNIVLKTVPEGACLLGSPEEDSSAHGEEKPQHQIYLYSYQLSLYPITNAQYALFIEDGGYENDRYWTEEGKAWRSQNGITYPEFWMRPGFDLPNQPVVGVSWYEAVAFCRWLTEKMREAGVIKSDEMFRLPTEAEWERAARGSDGRYWPWGDTPELLKADSPDRIANGLGIVGLFQAGASPFGVLDMVGKVWQWTNSAWQDYPYDPADGREDVQGHKRRVVRGGAWHSMVSETRVTHRRSLPLEIRLEEIGFRVALVSTSLRLEQNLPYISIEQFLFNAGFSVHRLDQLGLLCTSDHRLWRDTSPLYVGLALKRHLGLDTFWEFCEAARNIYEGKLHEQIALIIIDRPPRAGDLHQIFALRAQEGFTVVPLPRSLMSQARREGREMEALREQVDRYTGRTDLYDVRTAVTDVLSFFGRSRLLADLRRRLSAGRSLALFGVRKVGKSSLLGRLREEVPWPVALVDLEGYTGGLGYVYEEALLGWQAAVRLTFPALPLPEPPDWDGLPDAAAQARAFRRAVVDLLERLSSLPGRPGLLLFLDEMDVLFERPEYPDFAAVLRSVAEDPRCQGRFVLLAAGLEPTLNRVDRMGGARNPFYAFFGEVPLGPLAPEDARTMVVSIGGQMGVAYDEAALALLVEAGGGHPHLTRQLCSRAIEGLERPGRVEVERALRAIAAYLREPRNYPAESLWGMDAGGPPPAEADLLRALAQKQPQPTERLIPSDLPPADQRRYHLALEHLRDQSLVREVEEGWELTIPLYRRWLRRYVLNLPE